MTLRGLIQDNAEYLTLLFICDLNVSLSFRFLSDRRSERIIIVLQITTPLNMLLMGKLWNVGNEKVKPSNPKQKCYMCV